MLKEFRAFLLRGNVVDLAVAVVIGAAFGAVIASLVENVLTPLIGIIGGFDFSELHIGEGEEAIRYGLVLNEIITFVLIGTAIFFLVVKPINVLMARRKTEPEVDTTTKRCPECLSNIPKEARRCAFCTSEQPLAQGN